MTKKSAQKSRGSNTIVEKETWLGESASTENEEAEPPQPENWKVTIEKAAENPSSYNSIMVDGVRKLNGIYKCMGVKNNRPYFKKTNADYVIWFDAKEDIWTLTDSSALEEQDPELYGYLDSNAWDVTKIPKSKSWHLANAKGEWIKKVQMKIQKVTHNGGLLNSLLTNPVPETRIAAQAAVENSYSLMSSFWGDFKKVKRNVKENRSSINELKTNQENVKSTQRDILGRLEKLEKQRNSDKYDDLLDKIQQVEGQVKILSKESKSSGPGLSKSKKSRVQPSVEDLIRDNSLEKASINAMKNYLRGKRKQRITIEGKRILLTGTKSTLLNRIKKLLEKPGEVEVDSDDEDTAEKENQEEKKKTLRKAREQRALARQSKKQLLERSSSIRQRKPSSELEERTSKRRKYH